MCMITSVGQREEEMAERSVMMKGCASRGRYLCFYCLWLRHLLCSCCAERICVFKCWKKIMRNKTYFFNYIFICNNLLMQSAHHTNNLLVRCVFRWVGEEVCCLNECVFMCTYSPLWVWWADWFCSPHSCHWLPGRSNVPHQGPQWTGWPACCPGWWHWVNIHAHTHTHSFSILLRTLHCLTVIPLTLT